MTDQQFTAYQQPAQAVAEKYTTNVHTGLQDGDAKTRLEKTGPNTLPKKKPTSPFTILFSQFLSPLMFILMIAAAASLVIVEYTDAIVIGLAAAINVIVGFIQEWRAERAAEALREYEVPHATVRRDGATSIISARELVPGDIVLLAAGARVPADIRLTYVSSYRVEEALLTGESAPVSKTIEPLQTNLTIGDRTNMAYAGTYSLEGKAEGIVVATGQATALGDIVRLMIETEEHATPLQEQIRRLSWILGGLMGVILVGIMVLGFIKGLGWHQILTLSIALAVAAIPEGLLVAVTVILAVGMQRMLKRKALVRRLVAAETLGSVSVICTDKTGTLTQGRMAVVKIVTPQQEIELREPRDYSEDGDIKLALFAGALNNDAELSSDRHRRIGDPTEIALLEAAYDARLEITNIRTSYPRVEEIPFSEERKYMATVHDVADGQWLIVKGAPEVVFAMADGGPYKQRFVEKTEEMAHEGLRVLAFATRTADTISINGDLGTLEIVALVGMQDPLRPRAASTVKELEAAGIKLVLVTGDHRETAIGIARGAGVDVRSEGVMTGIELAALNEEELSKKITTIDVFARVDPSQKIRIVDAWQANGETVAMTGDGVNDAPALKAADIGVALGSGSDVSHETADMVLLDDNLSTIVAAVRQGRIIFDNIRKVIVYLLADSFSEIVLIAGSLLLGLPLPFTAAQILWINLVTDGFPHLALTMEPGEKGIMRAKPRPKGDPVINQQMKILIFIVGIVTDLGLFGLFWYLLSTELGIGHVRTVMFAALAFDSLLYVFSVRNLHTTIFKTNPFRNWWLNIAVIAGALVQCAALYVPFLQKLLNTVSLTITDWCIILVLSVVKLVCIELTKLWFVHKERQNVMEAK